jgi:hypothetical protein
MPSGAAVATRHAPLRRPLHRSPAALIPPFLSYYSA